MTLTDPQGFPRGLGVNDEITGRARAEIPKMPVPQVRKINGDYKKVQVPLDVNPEKMYSEKYNSPNAGQRKDNRYALKIDYPGHRKVVN